MKINRIILNDIEEKMFIFSVEVIIFKTTDRQTKVNNIINYNASESTESSNSD